MVSCFPYVHGPPPSYDVERSHPHPAPPYLSTSKPQKLVCFENWWLLEEDFQETAQQSWRLSTQRSISHKLRFLVADLKKWRAKKPKTRDHLQSIEDQILSQQNLHSSNQRLHSSTYSSHATLAPPTQRRNLPHTFPI
jgi:hypothetical protein